MSASNKTLLFLFGLVLGLLAGAGFFIFKMDELLKKVNLFNSSKDTIVIQQQPNIEASNASGFPRDSRYGQPAAPRKDTVQNGSGSAEKLASKYSKEMPAGKILAESDSLLRESARLAADSMAFLKRDEGESFVVRKDELLGTKNIEVTNLSAETTGNSDSLLEKVSGIKSQKNGYTSFKVEFWQSPVNYRGYKMTRNKIALYGLVPEESIRLFQLDDGIYLKYYLNVYKLDFTDDTKQFEKVTDQTILLQLK